MEKIKLTFIRAVESVIDVDYPIGRSLTTVILSALAIQLRMLIVPLIVLLVLMIADFITGLRAAVYRGETISSKKYLHGVEKKLCLLLLVAMGLVVDIALLYIAQLTGRDMTLPVAVAVIVSLWLVVNEVISILENIKDIGADMPAWLLPWMEHIRSKVDESAPKAKEENEDE